MCIHILDDLVIGKTRGATARIVERDKGLVAFRGFQDEIGQPAKLVARDQTFGVDGIAGIDGLVAHVPVFPGITLMLRKRAWAAAWVIHPD
jgi:hypothetical protein